MESKNKAREDSVELSVSQVSTSTHAGSSAVAVVLRSLAHLRDAHESVRHKVEGALEVRRVMIGRPHVLHDIVSFQISRRALSHANCQSYHYYRGPCRNDGTVVLDVFYALAVERQIQRGPVSQDFLKMESVL